MACWSPVSHGPQEQTNGHFVHLGNGCPRIPLLHHTLEQPASRPRPAWSVRALPHHAFASFDLFEVQAKFSFTSWWGFFCSLLSLYMRFETLLVHISSKSLWTYFHIQMRARAAVDCHLGLHPVPIHSRLPFPPQSSATLSTLPLFFSPAFSRK